MKKYLAEYAKIADRIGITKALKLAFSRMRKNNFFSIGLYKGKNSILGRMSGSDWMAFKQVFIWKEYDFPYEQHAATIIDAGANVGYASVWFANRFPGSKIISIEPDDNNFEMLKKNTADYPNIIPIKAGLWNRTGFLKIINKEAESWGFQTGETDAQDPSSIQAFDIASLMNMHGFKNIDILKLDVEGAEKVIFRDNYEEWIPKTKCIIIELHDFLIKDSSRTFFSVISKYNFSFHCLGENLFFFNQNLN